MWSPLYTAIICLAAIISVRAASGVSSKVFSYQGVLPIRDERSDESTGTVASNQTLSEAELAEAEAACWNTIVDRSVVTFALQNRVLDDLQSELNGLKVDDPLKVSIEKIVKSMRDNLREANEAVKKDAPEEYFDALFDASEDIINLSSLMRDPKLDESVFLVLVKAVSRLGRNNSALIQDFTEVCSFAKRIVRPRVFNLL